MAQSFALLQSTDTLTASRTTINNDVQSLQSNFSGTAFPTLSLLVGMYCYRTDTQCMYVLRSLAPDVWSLVFDATKTALAQEQADARYAQKTAVETVSGAWTFSANILTIAGADPKIKFDDTNRTAGLGAWWAYVNNASFYILYDSDNDGSWNSPHPLQLNAAGTGLLFGQTIWSAGNDGSGSGLDADLLDGLQASSFVRSDIAGVMNASLTVNGDFTVSGTVYNTIATAASNGTAYLLGYVDAGDQGVVLSHWGRSSASYIGGRTLLVFGQQTGDNSALGYFDIRPSFFRIYLPTSSQNIPSAFQVYWQGGWRTVWHSGNQGSGSGMDADMVDGREGARLDNLLVSYNHVQFTSVLNIPSAGTNRGDDTTEPLSDSGTAICSTDHTPSASGNWLIIEFSGSGSPGAADNIFVGWVAIFVGSELAGWRVFECGRNRGQVYCKGHWQASGTGSKNINVRGGRINAIGNSTQFFFNGRIGGATLGGSNMYSSITIHEVVKRNGTPS